MGMAAKRQAPQHKWSPEYEKFLTNLRRVRKDKGVSGDNLAEAIGLKFRDQYTRRENGVYAFSINDLIEINKVLRMPWHFLLGHYADPIMVEIGEMLDSLPLEEKENVLEIVRVLASRNKKRTDSGQNDTRGDSHRPPLEKDVTENEGHSLGHHGSGGRGRK
jgi:transcriptional regulator with XRE-family HTH domain